MKKYRFGDPGAPKKFKFRTAIYFGLAWNAFGYCLYKYLSSDKAEEWKGLSQSQKYLSMISDPDQKLSVISLRGDALTSSEETVESYTLPNRPILPIDD